MQWGLIVATLVGVSAGWGLSELTEWRRWRRAIRSKRRAFASALRCEIETFRDRYHELIGKKIETRRLEDYIKNYIPIQGNYFTVFDSNADKLGLLNQEDARQLISFYMRAKGQLDSLATLRNRAESFGPAPIPWEIFTEDYEKVRMENQHILLKAGPIGDSLKKYD